MTADSRDRDLDFARAIAEGVVERLRPDAPPLVVEQVVYYHGFDEHQREMMFSDEPSDDIRIVVRLDEPGASRVGAHLILSAPRAQSVAAVATHIQDYVLGHTHGELLPRCPGHRHPLQASVVDDTASWVCPQDREHHVEPILPSATEE